MAESIGRSMRSATGRWLRLVACFSLIGLPTILRAQSGEFDVQPQDSALRCLQPAEAAMPVIAYPYGALERKVEAIVRVRLTFRDATSAPDVEVFLNTADPAFAVAVRDRLAAYRLPCLKPGEGQVVATQEFQFVPGDARKVIWGSTHEAPDRDRRVSACLQGGPGQRTFSYPERALQAGHSGVVVVRMTFPGPDEPPKVEIITNAGNRPLGSAVKSFVEGYRLPCLPPQGRPVQATQAFKFSLSDQPQYVLKDLNLRDFLGVVDRLETHRVRFDFNTMGCPFDVKLRLYQPFMENVVGQVDADDLNRVEFIEWLKKVELKLSRDALRQVVGDTMNISVPCGTMDLL